MQGNKIDLIKEDIIFANISSLHNKKRKEILKTKKFDFAIFDEAHHIGAKKFNEIFKIISNNSNQILGMTATPEREDNSSIVKINFNNKIAFEYRIAKAIKEGSLCNFDY